MEVPEGTKMWDTATPAFSTLMCDYLDGLNTHQQIDLMKLIGVPHDRREVYLSAMTSGEHPVVSVPQATLPALTGSMDIINITPDMAAEGAPAPGRPQPRVGNRTPKVVRSTKKI